MSALETTIDGALCKLRIDQTSGRPSVLYQARNERGETKWLNWYRDTFYDAWTFDAMWVKPEDAPYYKSLNRRFEPDFDTDPIGWSELQIGKATVWAIEAEAEYARQTALKFIPSACLVQQQQVAE